MNHMHTVFERWDVNTTAVGFWEIIRLDIRTAKQTLWT